MNKIFNKIYLVLLMVITANGFLFAQGAPEISGYIETTYNYNFADTTINALRSYDARANQILLNNLHIALSGAPSDKVSYTAELDFGTDAAVHGLLHQAGLGAGPVAVDIQEAYISYAFSDKVSFTGGKFVTFEGIEVIEGPVNPTISRGYLYGLAESFTHVGGYFTFAASDEFDFKLGVVNGWDLLIDNNKDKTIIGRAGINLGDPLSFGVAFSWGVEQEGTDDARTSVDLTGVTNAIPGVGLNFQVNYGAETIGDVDAKWAGFGIQPVIALSDNIDLGARLEYFSDSDGVRTGTGITDFNTLNLTLVPTFKYDGFTFRFEYRFDSASDEIFPVSEDTPSKTSSTVSLGISANF